MWSARRLRKGRPFSDRELYVTQINAVDVEISVVLGRSVLPMSQLLRMGRGAVIPLDAAEGDEVWILANNYPVARGEIEIRDDRIAITVTRQADVYDFMAGSAEACIRRSPRTDQFALSFSSGFVYSPPLRCERSWRNW